MHYGHLLPVFEENNYVLVDLKKTESPKSGMPSAMDNGANKKLVNSQTQSYFW